MLGMPWRKPVRDVLAVLRYELRAASYELRATSYEQLSRTDDQGVGDNR